MEAYRHRLGRTSPRYRKTTAQNLSLSQEEIDVLDIILQHVGGQPAGPRGVIDSLRARLQPTAYSARDGKGVVTQGSLFIDVVR